MEFISVDPTLDIKGFSWNRTKGEGFFIRDVGLIRLIDFGSEVFIGSRDFDKNQGILVPHMAVSPLLFDIPYQIDDHSIFFKLIQKTDRNAIQFNFLAPQNVRIV